jgi:hypothetical protein
VLVERRVRPRELLVAFAKQHVGRQSVVDRRKQDRVHLLVARVPAGRARALERPLDPLEQYGRLEGLTDEVVRAGFETADDILRICDRSEQDHRNLSGELVLQRSAQVESIHQPACERP